MLNISFVNHGVYARFITAMELTSNAVMYLLSLNFWWSELSYNHVIFAELVMVGLGS